MIMCHKTKQVLMANALSRFIEKRNITVEELQQKELLHTLHGKPMNLTYLWVIMLKDNAGISLENIERLDKEFKLTEEEKTDLSTMIKKGRRGRTRTSPVDVDKRREQRRLFSATREHESVIGECNSARDLIVRLRKKRDEFKLLLCVNWEQHAQVSKLSPPETMQTLINQFADNRIDAAKIQLELLRILWRIEGIVKTGLREEIEIFGKIPSVFQMFESTEFEKQTDFVATQGKEKLYSLINKDVQQLNSDFVSWVSEEAKKNSGLVDITGYKTQQDFLNLESWLSVISFTDLSYAETGMPFLPIQSEMLKFFGIEDVITIVEESAKRKVAELKSEKVLPV